MRRQRYSDRQLWNQGWEVATLLSSGFVSSTIDHQRILALGL
ncbi:hypothetical protein [Ferrimicrobium sp.]|nr:hypothetical protein [Ferrimicrobium sp.]